MRKDSSYTQSSLSLRFPLPYDQRRATGILHRAHRCWSSHICLFRQTLSLSAVLVSEHSAACAVYLDRSSLSPPAGAFFLQFSPFLEVCRVKARPVPLKVTPCWQIARKPTQTLGGTVSQRTLGVEPPRCETSGKQKTCNQPPLAAPGTTSGA